MTVSEITVLPQIKIKILTYSFQPLRLRKGLLQVHIYVHAHIVCKLLLKLMVDLTVNTLLSRNLSFPMCDKTSFTLT